MIDEKKIEEAANKYENTLFGSDSAKENAKEGFVDGAKWVMQEFLKKLWHDANEEPVYGDILVESTYASDRFSQKCYFVEDMGDIDVVYYDWKEYIELNDVTRWLYIEDLLPKQKGGEQCL